MNKVTKDLIKWFPDLTSEQSLDLYIKLIMEGVDFSEVSNAELKAEAARLLRGA
jgi:hypothetical protein